MNLLARARSRLTALFRKRRLQQDMAEEMSLHLAHRTEQRIQAGLSPDEARYAALRAFGPVTQVQEQCREQRGWQLLERIQRDFSYAARSLAKSPGFTVVALLTLALGIGANTAVFSLVKSVLLNPLPYPHGEQLVTVWDRQRAVDVASFSWPDFAAYQRQNRAFSALAGYRLVTYVFTGEGEPEQLAAAQISASMFSVLGLSPQLGRAFNTYEDRSNSDGLVLLTDALWRRRFGADPNVAGRVLRLDAIPFTVIGVLPPEFTTFANVDFVTQLGRPTGNAGWNLRTTRPGIFGLGRLKDGVTLPQALADLERVGRRLAQDYPEVDSASTASGELLFEKTVGSYRKGLWLLLGAVGLVLLIACANLANLLLARGAGREAEFAIRAALGASRARIMGESMAESLLVALGGGALGLLLTFAANRSIAALSPAGVARFQNAHIDAGILAAAFGISLITALIFGGWPAWRAAQTDLRAAAQGAGRTVSAGRGVVRARELLIIAEVALTLVLLVGAGLLLKSFERTQAVDLGFQTHGVLTARVKVPWSIYNTQQKLLLFDQRLLENVSSLRGVRSAALVTYAPLASAGHTASYSIDGYPAPAAGQTLSAEINIVSDGYFDVLGIPILRGRTFNSDDALNTPRTAVVDRAFAERYWPVGEALGKTIRLSMESLVTVAILNLSGPRPGTRPAAGEPMAFTVVGIAPHVQLHGYAAESRLPQIYISGRQNPTNTFTLVVKGQGDLGAIMEPIRQAVRRVDSNQALSEVRTFDDHLSSTFAASRLYTFLLTIFASLALLLASVGLYGVLAYQVSSRRREFGIRLALGGLASQVAALVLRRGMRLIGIGFAIGMMGALALGRVLGSLLYRTSAFDSGVFLCVTGLLVVVSLAASWLPSRRAARVAPSEALRAQ